MRLLEGEAAVEVPHLPFAVIVGHRFVQHEGRAVMQHAFISEQHLHRHKATGRTWVRKESNVALFPHRHLACDLRAIPIVGVQVHVQGERHPEAVRLQQERQAHKFEPQG